MPNICIDTLDSKTIVPWVNDAPDFSTFTDPTLSVLTNAWNTFINNGGVVEIVPDPEPYVEPATPNWDGFNGFILSDITFNTYYGAGLTTAPAVTSSLPAALAQVATNGVGAFAMVFNGFCGAAGVTSEHRGLWANEAEDFNLPTDFVNVVRGN